MHRPCEGGPERHLLPHRRDHRHSVHLTFLEHLCEEDIEERYVVETVDEDTVHQIKNINREMLTTTAEGG